MAKFKGQKGKRGPDRVNKSNHSMNIDRPKSDGKGGQNMRDRATIKRLQMYRNYKAKRDSKGKITRPAPFQSWLPSGTVARVEPNRKWFGNTRVVTQTALQTFQDEMEKVKKDPYKMVMRQTKLPISLLNEAARFARPHLLDTESYKLTFGPKSQRKRPNIKASDLQALCNQAEEQERKYNPQNDSDLVVESDGMRDEAIEMVFKAGQSKRVWNELYKVIDSSDVVVQVLDARDPLGTRCYQIEKYLKSEKKHKQLIFILNKVDLVPVWVTQKWVTILSTEYPTMAFHASLTNAFGKGALINLLRQFSKLHSDKKQISVGFIGYPNVGKSSIINTLRKKKVCKVAPLAGETKVWQYVTLMRRIYLVDCPGVVYPSGFTPEEIVLKGVVRVEHLKNPEDYIAPILQRVRIEYIQRTYKIDQWKDPEDFLEQLAKRCGKLLKGGDPDFNNISKMVLNDWQRGRIPYFVKPPLKEGEEEGDTKTSANQSTPSLKDSKSTDATSQGFVHKVQQDFNKIRVEPNFVAEDVKKINLEVSKDGSDVEPSDDEDDEEDTKDEEEPVIPIKENEDAGNDDAAKKFVALMTSSTDDVVEKSTDDGERVSEGDEKCLKDNENKEETKLDQNRSETSSGEKKVSKTDDMKTSTSEKSEESAALDTKDNSIVLSKKEELQSSEKNEKSSPKKLQTISSGSGKFLVIPSKEEESDDEEFMYKLKEPVSSFSGLKTKTQNSPMKEEEKKKQKKRRKRRHEDDDEEEEVKLTAKQRRKIARSERNKKIGHHFYSYANVKNRSNRSRKGDDSD